MYNCKATYSLVLWLSFILNLYSQNANFNLSANRICENNRLILTPVDPSGIVTWDWDFGEGAFPATSNAAGPHVVSYASNGNKTIRLTVSNGTNTTTQTRNLIVDITPTADFSVTGNRNVIPANLTFQIININNWNVNHNFNFGDPFSGTTNTSTNQWVNRSYNFGGNYFACLSTTVQNSSCNNTQCQEIVINAGSNTVQSRFNVSPTVSTCVGNPVQITDISIAPNSNRQWNFGSGAVPPNFTGLTPPPVAWSTPGPKVVAMRANNSGNNNNNKVSSQLIQVYEYPLANFSVIGNTCTAGNELLFEPQQQPGYVYHWRFSDGTTSTTPFPRKTFAAGDHQVTLTVTKNGCSSTFTSVFNVGNGCPPNSPTRPAFSVRVSRNECLEKVYEIEPLNTGGATSYTWNFGAGATVTPPNLTTVTPERKTVRFSTPGPHTVTLTVNGTRTISYVLPN